MPLFKTSIRIAMLNIFLNELNIVTSSIHYSTTKINQYTNNVAALYHKARPVIPLSIVDT